MDAVVDRLRTLKPGAFQTRDIARVPPEIRFTFLGLWTHCDDNGYADDDPALIAAQVYPRDRDIDGAVIEQHLAALAAAHLICRFEGQENDTGSYLHVPGLREPDSEYWQDSRHHKLGNTPGCPWPHEDMQPVLFDAPAPDPSGPSAAPRRDPPRSAAIRRDPPRNAASSSNSKSSSSSKTLGQLAPAGSDSFAAFWLVYPRKVGKLSAQKAWAKAIKAAPDPQVLVEGAARYAQQRAGQEQRFTKHPATWLNGGCWMDEPAQRAPAPPAAMGMFRRSALLAEQGL